MRDLWLRFDWLAEKVRDRHSEEEAQKALEWLIAEHRAVLDEIVVSGVLSEAVAEQVQGAFQFAAQHVWNLHGPVLCYRQTVLSHYWFTSSEQLIKQSALLAELSKRGDLDPMAVSQARVAIERDIAFLSLSNEETNSLFESLIRAAEERDTRIPAFDELDLDVNAKAAQAARFLSDLLLGRSP